MGAGLSYVSFSAPLLNWEKQQTGTYLLPELFLVLGFTQSLQHDGIKSISML